MDAGITRKTTWHRRTAARLLTLWSRSPSSFAGVPSRSSSLPRTMAPGQECCRVSRHIRSRRRGPQMSKRRSKPIKTVSVSRRSRRAWAVFAFNLGRGARHGVGVSVVALLTLAAATACTGRQQEAPPATTTAASPSAADAPIPDTASPLDALPEARAARGRTNRSPATSTRWSSAARFAWA